MRLVAWPGAVCRHHRCPVRGFLSFPFLSLALVLLRHTDRDMATLPRSLHHALNPTHCEFAPFTRNPFTKRVVPEELLGTLPLTRACGNDTAESRLGTTLNVPPTILISAKIAVTLLNSQMMQCSALAERNKRAGSCPSSGRLTVSLHADHQNTTLPCFAFIKSARSRRFRAVTKTSHHLLNVGQSTDHLPNSGTCPGCVKELLIYQDH